MYLKQFETILSCDSCTTAWRHRLNAKSLGYFGTGECFVFTLAPEVRCYKWVGSRAAAAGEADGVKGASLSQLPQMFQAADARTLLVGGGGGGAVIRLDHDFCKCSSRQCDTFASPPLVPSGDFECATVEVIGFTSS